MKIPLRNKVLLLCALSLAAAIPSARAKPAAAVATPTPFAVLPPKPGASTKPATAPQFQKTLACFGSAKTWVAGGTSVPADKKLFAVEKNDSKDTLRIYPKAFDAGQTVVGYRVTPEEAKGFPNYASFSCKSTKDPVRITFHLLSRALDGPGAKVIVLVNPGKWQRVVIPFAEFGVKGTPKYQAIGVGVDTPNDDSEVLLADFALGSTSLSPDTLKARRTVIPISGLWRFAGDPGTPGAADKWSAPDFDDTGWQVLKTGLAWADQGVSFGGWGWYRQKILVPQESQGAPLTIVLAELAYDDDVWFNGVHIGGLVGNYPYYNHRLRTYSVPPEAVQYGKENTIAVRTWGGSSWIKAGLMPGVDAKLPTYEAELDPWAPRLRSAATKQVETMPDHFDLSSAQQGAPFEVVFRFPGDALKGGAGTLLYTLSDFYGNPISTGQTPVSLDKDGLAQAVVSVDEATSRTLYLRGRFKAFLAMTDSSGVPVATDARFLDRFSFAARDTKQLPALSTIEEDTPYGKLKLVDTIDCSTPVEKEEHPYMQSGFNHADDRMTPGAPLDVTVSDILGKKARESAMGFFAYRIGRGKLKPHTNYLLRVEYPEDKRRFAPFEIQNGHSFMDIGWKNGVSPNDPYDNWPLSHAWQWYDAIVSLDQETTGTGGTGSASAENGVWVYFMNKKKPGRYFIQYDGGCAIGQIKLYEIDPEKNAPVINKPKDVPQRVLMVDWERQADQNPEDIVRYCKLMGYNTVSPIMLKWGFMNYGEPLDGYDTTVVDALRYWDKETYKGADEEEAPAPEDAEASDTADAEPAAKPKEAAAPKSGAGPLLPGIPSVHVQYLAATKKYGVNYVPRIEYGGSLDIPSYDRAIGGDGEIAKPDRFAQWGGDLLNPATWPDMARTVDNYFKPYIKDNPQLTGMLWRVRMDRMQISYSRVDIDLFAKETNTTLPDLSSKDLAGWASSGEVGEHYSDWWHEKRAQFHAKLVDLLKTYRPDLTLYYYNWDADKWALWLRDMDTASTFVEMATARYGLVSKVYERHVEEQKRQTGEDYIRMVRTGQLNDFTGWGHDYGLHTELYQKMPGMQLLAPANNLYLTDNPTYLNYFKTGEGLAVSNVVSYDESGARSINPKYEGNMVLPAGSAFSMAMEVLACFNGDPRTLTYTVYTYGRGFAGAHRRFAQAFLALPAMEGKVVEGTDNDVKVRQYATKNGTYVSVVYKGYAGKKLSISLPDAKSGATVTNLVTNAAVPTRLADGKLQFDIDSGPMELNAFLLQY